MSCQAGVNVADERQQATMFLLREPLAGSAEEPRSSSRRNGSGVRGGWEGWEGGSHVSRWNTFSVPSGKQIPFSDKSDDLCL